MPPKRGRDDESTLSIAKRFKLAEPLLRKYKSILEEVQRPLERDLALVQLILLDAPTSDSEEEVDQDEQISFEFSEVTEAVLETRFGVQFSRHDWTPQGIQLTATSSKYRNDNLEPLFHELETISVSSEFEADAVRLLAESYLFFVLASIKEKREIQIKAAIKARIESDVDFDIMSLMPLSCRAEDREQALSAFLESREKAGLPSRLSIDDQVEFIWSSNDLVTRSGFLDLEGVKDSCHMRLLPGIIIDPDDPNEGFSAPLHDQNGRKITLYGVVDYGMFVYKKIDDDCVHSAGCYSKCTKLSRAKSVEARLIFIETKFVENGYRRSVCAEPLVEASAQALAFSARFKIPSVRFIVTNSEDWVVAHLHNPLDGGTPKVVSDLTNPFVWGNPYLKLYATPLERDKEIVFWRKNVRTIYGVLMEWLLPETMSAIPNPP
ncbi:uncharacterized protein ARMOST_12081 [Armillaria ostoyae]|uniref:Uncharacterized protein n=1 Tax=Armillaria ostoyae TaxID=47428 RepID=A0A284RIZ1_ARMOS|nr:uncharacterized protein ARMOST_12081 [Armillaria ostoyae]